MARVSLPLGPGNAYVYDIATPVVYLDHLSRLGEQHRLWHLVQRRHELHDRRRVQPTVVNNFADQNQPIGQAYIVDYDSATGQFSNWTSFSNPAGSNFDTHFEGISSTENGVYTISADSNQNGTGPLDGFAGDRRAQCRRFVRPRHLVEPDLHRHRAPPAVRRPAPIRFRATRCSASWSAAEATFAYTANVNTGFQLSNVISGNGTNGIELNDASEQPDRHELHRHRFDRHGGLRQRRRTASWSRPARPAT